MHFSLLFISNSTGISPPTLLSFRIELKFEKSNNVREDKKTRIGIILRNGNIKSLCFEYL